jgi:hypothetical protein
MLASVDYAKAVEALAISGAICLAMAGLIVFRSDLWRRYLTDDRVSAIRSRTVRTLAAAEQQGVQSRSGGGVAWVFVGLAVLCFVAAFGFLIAWTVH